VIWGFVDEDNDRLGYDALLTGNLLPMKTAHSSETSWQITINPKSYPVITKRTVCFRTHKQTAFFPRCSVCVINNLHTVNNLHPGTSITQRRWYGRMLDLGGAQRIWVAYPGILFGGGSTYSVDDRENGDLWAVAP